jgi:hypothetical protein
MKMVEIRVDLKDLPADIGFVLVDRQGRTPKRFYNDVEIDKVWSCIMEKIQGKTDVNLLIVGFMPCIMPARLTYNCLDAGVRAFSICRPGGLVEVVYDMGAEA